MFGSYATAVPPPVKATPPQPVDLVKERNRLIGQLAATWSDRHLTEIRRVLEGEYFILGPNYSRVRDRMLASFSGLRQLVDECEVHLKATRFEVAEAADDIAVDEARRIGAQEPPKPVDNEG